MFGYHKAKRAKKKAKEERKALERERADLARDRPALEHAQQQEIKRLAGEDAATAKQERRQAEQEGRADTESFFQKDIQGLTPNQRHAMQFEANKQIQRQEQAANRRLLGEQGRHGIVGKGGVAYSQQRDLQKVGNEARGQVNRDLDKLNADLQLKKLAAIYAGGKGEAAQSQLDKQLALDALELNEEKRRQRRYEDQFNRLFSRV